ncbi:hypothetical protein CYLTODRAFT_451440 [Cylindrobasidium torrendii FP15055 ss-10]|uniref:DUF6534 domain-containing protein n=1 Tax=Cylindrobasidium torrendii FP15055 ss-10 TaxID=1314674 RepID=A0A0D7BM68_9AGAR|nr:hypothetical protein CYLTODRAFT_451440 [Cylindrobasidium torrendii FP15055 ss-10]
MSDQPKRPRSAEPESPRHARKQFALYESEDDGESIGPPSSPTDHVAQRRHLPVLLAIFYIRTRGAESKTFYLYSVVAAIFIDLAASLLVLINVWEYYVLLPADAEVIENAWSYPAGILLSYASATLEQLFFAHRYHAITRNKYVTSVILLLVLGHDVSAVITAISISMNLAFYNQTGVNLSLATATISVANDVLIVIAMIWGVGRIETYHQETRGILRRVAVFSVSCGLTTAVTTALVITLLQVDLQGWFFLFYSQGRIYSLTVLINLLLLRSVNRRQAHSTGSDADDDDGRTTDTGRNASRLVFRPLGATTLDSANLTVLSQQQGKTEHIHNSIAEERTQRI